MGYAKDIKCRNPKLLQFDLLLRGESGRTAWRCCCRHVGIGRIEGDGLYNVIFFVAIACFDRWLVRGNKSLGYVTSANAQGESNKNSQGVKCALLWDRLRGIDAS